MSDGKKPIFLMFPDPLDPRYMSDVEKKLVLELWEQAKPKTDGSPLKNGKCIVCGTSN